VRLRFEGGSSVEGERELGFMHVLEHMLFHGSTNLPEGSLPLLLKQQGLKRWSDFDAFTSFDETVYRLDLAKADSGARETALMLMREVSSNLRFDRRAVKGAKEKVQEEIRGRDLMQDRMTTAQHAFFMPGAPLARGPVAGTVTSVGRVDGTALQRLYQRYYTPKRTVLVMAGDFDPAVAEAEIVARFADWRSAEEPERDRRRIERHRGLGVRLFVDPAADTLVTIASVEPLGSGDETRTRDSHFLQHLGSEMLSRRLSLAATADRAPVSGGNSAIYDHFGTARLARIEVTAKERDWRAALQAGEMELRRALEHGFTQRELDEQMAASRRALAQAAAPRTTAELADAIVDSAGRGIVFTEPADRAASGDYLSRVRLDAVNRAFRAAWAGDARLIFVSHNRNIPGSEAAIAAAWAKSRRAAISGPAG